MMVVSNLVGQLAWSRDLDTTCPVGIDVTEGISQIFNDLLGKVLRLVQGHEIVDRHNTALSCLLWNKEEVKLAASIFILDKTRIKDGTRLRISKSSFPLIVDKHSLVDPLVHNDKSKLWLVHLVVELSNNLSHLRKFFVFNDGSHSLTNSVAENHNLSWKFPNIGLELLESSSHKRVKLRLDDLLILWLDDEVREV
jgi:hypothetical protein